jgi:hypothetical protein
MEIQRFIIFRPDGNLTKKRVLQQFNNLSGEGREVGEGNLHPV